MKNETKEESLAGYPVSSMLKEGTKACDGDAKLFAYDFNWLMSAIVGIILVVILFFYSIDVAVRLIKLGILQLLAPIPIISYIDPKSSKDGAFASWVKMSTSTYLDLFIKLAMFYFVIFILSSFAGGDTNFVTMPSGLGVVAKSYVTIMIVVGAMFFLMQGPKFIYGMLGIKNPNQGIGLAGALAGTAALIGGAGFMGAAAAATRSMAETSQAAGQGKQAQSGWSTGSDLAAQLRTGDSKAKGGFINNYVRNASRNAQQSTAARTLASRFGITQQGLDDSKQKMLADQDRVEAMQLAYQSGQSQYSYKVYERDANGNLIRDALTGEYQTRTVTESFALRADPNYPSKQVIVSAAAIKSISDAKTAAAKSKSNHDKASKIAEQYGLDQTTQEKFRSSWREQARYQANRFAHPINSRRDTAPDRQGLRDRVGGRNNWNSGAR